MLLQFNHTETTRMLTTITPKTSNLDTLDAVDVIVASLNGKLAIHRSTAELGYSLTHVPSGFAVATRIVSLREAEDLMLVLENRANWNFRSVKSKIWQNQKNELWGLVKDLKLHPVI